MQELKKTTPFQSLVAILLLILITLLVRPWRNSVSQDDATYAAQTIRFATGQFQLHPDSIAFILPQTRVQSHYVYSPG